MTFFAVSFALFCLYSTASSQALSCTCQASNTDGSLQVKYVWKNVDSSSSMIGVYYSPYPNPTAYDCKRYSLTYQSLLTEPSEGEAVGFYSVDSESEYYCVLWSGQSGAHDDDFSCDRILDSMSFNCRDVTLNTETDPLPTYHIPATTTQPRRINLGIVLFPAILLLAFLVAVVIRRFRNSMTQDSPVQQYTTVLQQPQEFELAPFTQNPAMSVAMQQPHVVYVTAEASPQLTPVYIATNPHY